MLRFLVQVGFSVTVMAFCIFMISTGKADTEKREALYWTGLSTTAAYWLPNPNISTPEMSKRKKQPRADKEES